MESEGHDSRAIANYFLRKAAIDPENGRRLTVMELIKLVYFAHGWFMGHSGRPLICHPVEAWKLGPVIPEVYEAFRTGVGPQEVRKLAMNKEGSPYEAELDEDEKLFVDKVYGRYMRFTAHEMSDITHEKGAPWDQVRDDGPYALIPNKIIREFYAARIRKHRQRVGVENSQ